MLTTIIFPHNLANCLKVKNIPEKILTMQEYIQKYILRLMLTKLLRVNIL